MTKADEKSTVAKTVKSAKKKPVRKTTARKTTKARKTTRKVTKRKVARITAVKKVAPEVDVPQVSTEERQSQIAAAAFKISQIRGFQPGHEFEDWLAAEAEIDARVQTG